MSNFIKSNSCLLAFDSSPAFSTGEKLGLFFASLLQDVEFSVSPARTQNKQIGSQEYGVDAVNFSPDVIYNLSYVSQNDFETDMLLGALFRPDGNYQSVFSGVRDYSFNGYLFFSEQQSSDLIRQIIDNQSFSGVNVVAFGNSYLTNANISYKAGSLPRTSCSLIASNVISETLVGNYMQIPAINLESGTTGNAAQILLDPAQASRMDTTPSGVLKTWAATFQPSFENVQIPNQELTSAVVNGMDISLSIDRENSYGFGSDYVFGRDIKYPIQCSVSINGIVNEYHSGSFYELMKNESKQTIEIFYQDPQEVFLSGLSNEQVSGISDVEHLVKNKWLKFDNCVLQEKRDAVATNGLLEFSNQFSTSVTESRGMTFKQGEEFSIDDVLLHSADFHEVVSRDGYSPVHYPFLQCFEDDCSIVNLLSSDRQILMTLDNFIEGSLNPTCSVVPTPPTWVFTDYHGQDVTSFYSTWPLEWELTEPFDSFNVYRNGVLIANTTEKTYLETLPEFEFSQYTVSSVLNGQESEIPESQYLNVQYVDILETVPLSPYTQEGSETDNGVANVVIWYTADSSYEFGDVQYVFLYRNWSLPSDSVDDYELISIFENGNNQYEDAGLTDIGKTYSYKITISISPKESQFSEPTSITRV